MLNKERAVQYLGFSDIPHLLIGIPTVAFFFPIVFFKADLSQGLLAYLPKLTISFIYTTSYWISIRELLFHMRIRYRTPEETPRRILYTIIGVLIIFIIVNSVVGLIHHDVLGFGDPMATSGLTHYDYKLPSLTVIILVASIYEGIFFYQRWKEAIIETEQLKRENVQSQLEGLKSQVNPHFLFNSLNTLIYIIPEDPDKAVVFVRKLSKVYRYILEIRDKELISVAEELAFLQSYIFLLKERFGESFQVVIDVPEEHHEDKIVPLSLQMLLENAIKHNVISKSKPLLVELYIDEKGVLVIRNNLQKKVQQMPSTNVGLENIKKRYAFFTENRVIVQETPSFFTVSLPLVGAKMATLIEE